MTFQAHDPRVDERPRVCLAVPTGNGWIHKRVVEKVFAILQDPRYRVRYIHPTWSPSEYNRARITEEFLRYGEDWLLMIDADNPPLNNPLNLIDLNKDVIGCPTPVWYRATKEGDQPYYYNVLRQSTDDPDGYMPIPETRGLVEVDAVGAGCILIARRVLAALAKSQPWVRRYDEIGYATLGSDYSFCRKAKAAGYRIWAHLDYVCEHFHELPLQDTIGHMHQQSDIAASKARAELIESVRDGSFLASSPHIPDRSYMSDISDPSSLNFPDPTLNSLNQQPSTLNPPSGAR